MRTTWTNIQLVRNSGEENSGDCSPKDAARASKNTRGKTKTPGEAVRYLTQKARKKMMTKNPSRDSEWCTVVGARSPVRIVSSTSETKWKTAPSRMESIKTRFKNSRRRASENSACATPTA